MQHQSKSNHDTTILFLKKYAYLFLIDIVDICRNKTYSNYEENEKGYGKAMLNALCTAFNQKIDRKISVDLIKKIHYAAMSHLPNSQPGTFKTKGSDVKFFLPVRYQKSVQSKSWTKLQIQNTNTIIEGFWQFITTWIFNAKKPLHYVLLQSEKIEIDITPINSYGIRGSWIQKYEGGQLSVMEYKQGNQKLKQQIELVLKDDSFTCFNLSAPQEIIDSMEYKSIQQAVTDQLEEICADYNQAIIQATSDQEKSKTIIKYVQLIAQLHASNDGNIRTCYVLLNRLLDEESLSFTLLVNPNRLEFFSVDQLMTSVTQGQEYLATLIKQKIPVFNDEYMAVSIPTVSPVELPAVDNELNDFINVIIKNKCRIQNKEAATSNNQSTYNPRFLAASQTDFTVPSNLFKVIHS